MRIALAYNEDSPDAPTPGSLSPTDLHTISTAVEQLGHEVLPVEVSGPVGRIADGLTACRPDLVLDVAEGHRGGMRQLLYPALLDDLGLPHTGSPAHVLATALDKHLTKLVLRRAGLDTPEWVLLRRPGGAPRGAREADLSALTPPLIVKPDAEGWSTGITQDSVAETPREALRTADELLARYPGGVLVEEFVTGRDMTVGYLEAADNGHGGALDPMEYVFAAPEDTAGHAVFDQAIKSGRSTTSVDRARARLPEPVDTALREAALTAVHALGCRDFARADFRLTPDGTPRLLEVNATPTLRPGRGMAADAPVPGAPALRNIADALLTSAAHRHGLPPDGPHRPDEPGN